jgi:hypothetical protein
MLKFNKEKHEYTVNGKVYPSVTQILSRIAVRESDDEPWNSLSGSEFFAGQETAAKYGIELHKVAALFMQGKAACYDPLLEPSVQGLRNFLEDENLNDVVKGREYASLYIVEEPLYSDLGFAGSEDWFFYFEIQNPKTKLDFPRCLLIDWKTSTSLNKKTSRMQTAAYRQMVIERYNLRNNIKMPRWTVRFDQKLKRGYEVDKRTTEPEDWILFQSCLNVYKNFI